MLLLMLMARLGIGLLAIGLLAAACKTRTGEPDRPAPAAQVSAKTCAGCHAAIYQSYLKTGMGRSFSALPDTAAAQAASYYHRASDRHYAVEVRDGALYQKRHQMVDGAAANVFEKRAVYVLGSGNHSRTYLYRGGEGRLYQLPLSWYAGKGGYWAMSPGYDRPDHKDFRRAITYDCMFCHNGYPAGGAPGDSVFPAELPQGIDCQRCHGPGGAHVQAAATKRPPAEIRSSILNPARLPRDRQLEVCMQCHLETTSRPLPYSVVRRGREVFSYDPREPLSAYILHFDHPTGAGPKDKFEIAHAAYRLRQSACFLQSSTLTCTTCHDPHTARRGLEAAPHYRRVCQSCHSNAHRPAEECASCHMPKRRTDDVIHVVMTDHLIQRTKPARNLLAPLNEIAETAATQYRGPVAAYYPANPDELHLAVAQVTDGANLGQGIARLRELIERHRPPEADFYFDLAEAYWRQGDAAAALPYYRETLNRSPRHAAAIRNLGVALRRLDRFEEAANILERLPSDAQALATLGDIYLALGRGADSERVLRHALKLDPDSPEAWNNLGRTLAHGGNSNGAVDALRSALRVRPDFAAAHNNLAIRLTDRNQVKRHFEQALRHDPKYAEAHFNYGTALASWGDLQRAETHLKAAAAIDPGLAEAHNNLGNLYGMRGMAARAAESFRKALAANPSLGSARINLAVALGSLGKVEEAQQEFTAAAQSNDPEIREAALRGLRALNR